MQFLGRNLQLKILCQRVSGMADVGEKTWVAKKGANPGTQWRDLIGPWSVGIENHPLSKKHRKPRDPQIARVDKVCFPKDAPKWESQAAEQMPQHGGTGRCPSSDDGETPQRR